MQSVTDLSQSGRAEERKCRENQKRRPLKRTDGQRKRDLAQELTEIRFTVESIEREREMEAISAPRKSER